MANYGFKVSKPGHEVLTAVEKDLIYTSKRDSFKPIKMISTSSATTVAHGVGYVPAFMYFIRLASGQFSFGASGDYTSNSALVAVDGTNVYTYTSTQLFILLMANPLET